MNQREKRENMIGAAMKTVAVLASVYGLCRNFEGPLSLSYFTDLSNIFLDFVLLVFLCNNISSLRSGEEKKISNGWYIVKFMAVISITLTFLVYLTLLAPTDQGGFLHAYFSHGAGSFCVHFVAPVLGILDFILYDYRYVSSRLHILYSIVPAYCYVIFVLILSHFGVRWKSMCAPYNFLNFGAPTGWFGFDLSLMGSETLGIGVAYMIVVLTILFSGIGALFLVMKDARRRKVMGEK